MHRLLPVLVFAAGRDTARASRCSGGRQLITSLEGSFGGPPHCEWHLQPGKPLAGVNFNTTSNEMHGSDSVAFYGGSLPLVRNRAGRFNSRAQLPTEAHFAGADEVLIVLVAEHPNTSLGLRFECILADPSARGGVSVTLWLMASALGFIIQCFCCFAGAMWFARQQRRRALRRMTDDMWSVGLLLQYAQLRRSRELDRSARLDQRECCVSEALAALPTRAWSKGDRAGGTPRGLGGDECCLCMVELEEEDVLRELPCGHHYHRDCIDRWFASKRFQPRSCPLCKADPVEGLALPTSSTLEAGGAASGDDDGARPGGGDPLLDELPPLRELLEMPRGASAAMAHLAARGVPTILGRRGLMAVGGLGLELAVLDRRGLELTDSELEESDMGGDTARRVLAELDVPFDSVRGARQPPEPRQEEGDSREEDGPFSA